MNAIPLFYILAHLFVVAIGQNDGTVKVETAKPHFETQEMCEAVAGGLLERDKAAPPKPDKDGKVILNGYFCLPVFLQGPVT